MITEFEEHSRGSTQVQFTVSRTSLPNLLEWSDRLQARFGVTIDIQWELEAEAVRLSDTPQVRWVMLSGETEACKKAMKYITIFCESDHQMDITYPEYIHTELKESQVKLEETYSTVMQFFKVGQLLLKSNDELNLSLVVSVIEEMDARTREAGTSARSSAWPGSRGSAGQIKESDPFYFVHDDLAVDASLKEGTTPTGESRPQTSSTPAPGSRISFPEHGARDLLGGEPLMLRSKGDHILPGQIIDLLSPASSHRGLSISPDRKKIRAEEEGSQGLLHREPKAHSGTSRPSDLNLLMLTLSSQQKLAIERILKKGQYTQWEVDQFLQRARSDWQCSDLIEMLHDGRKLRNIAQAPSRRGMTPGIKLEKLKSTQVSLMQSLLGDGSADPIVDRSSTEYWPQRFPPPAHQAGALLERQPAKAFQDTSGAERKQFSEKIPTTKHLTQMAENTTPSVGDDVFSIDDTDSVIIIASDNEIVLDHSMDESYTPEVFYKSSHPKKPPQPKREVTARRARAASIQQNAELHGIIESLRQQVADLQEKMEREQAEASSQQHVVTLLQQTQQEEMQRQYELQQRRLLEQQQQLQSQFELQEKEMKVQQELALKELQQHQQQQAAAPDTPSQAIIIAQARKNLDNPFRPVVIDGSNVAMKHGRNTVFSCRGIALSIQYFQKRGHQDITVFVPHGRSTQNPNWVDRPMSDQKILDMLERHGLLSYTPSRRIGNNYVNCYDDRFIVELAVKNGGVIVSNDNYRDLMGESPEWKHVIENRLVMYTFAGDHFMIPDDPLGRNGPRIDVILRKPGPPGVELDAAGRPEQHPAPSGPSSNRPPQGSVVPTGATPWLTGSASGAQVVQRGSLSKATAAKPATGPSSQAPAKPKLAAALGQVPHRDPAKHPSYETLIAIFPNNLAEIGRVLAQHWDTKDANELVLLILVEKEKSETK